jgi:hypothetical protein
VKRIFEQSIRRLTERTLHWAEDLYGSFLTVIGVLLFKIPLKAAEFMGWLEPDEAHLLSQVHLMACVATLLVIGCLFIGKLVAEHQRENKTESKK